MLGALLVALGVATGALVVGALAGLIGGILISGGVIGIYRFIRIVTRTDKADSPTDSMLHDPAFVVNLVLYAGAVVAIIYLAP